MNLRYIIRDGKQVKEVYFDCCNIRHTVETKDFIICPSCYSNWKKFEYICAWHSSPKDGYIRHPIMQTEYFRNE